MCFLDNSPINILQGFISVNEYRNNINKKRHLHDFT